MFKLLQELFMAAEKPNGAADEHELELAAAVLMIEIAYADHDLSVDEEQTMAQSLKGYFSLTESETESIIELAHQLKEHTVSLHEYTRRINDSLAMAEKIRILEMLWVVAYADDDLDKYEEYYIRKIADLLYISHSDYIRTKLQVKESDFLFAHKELQGE